ncbi:hypothetical protein [Micromonospora humida]|uniref:hypothetical protein n=1 Tax=Micromonospora humida TaxID=2809018 RepID=UPI0033D5202F
MRIVAGIPVDDPPTVVPPDAPAWIGAIAAVVAALAAFMALRHAKMSARAARVAAQAAARQAAAAERQVELAELSLRVPLSPSEGRSTTIDSLAEAALPDLESPDVALWGTWECRYPVLGALLDLFNLRVLKNLPYLITIYNIGTEPAHDVEVDYARFKQGFLVHERHQLVSRTIQPSVLRGDPYYPTIGESMKFQIKGTLDQRPHVLWMRWRGNPQWRAVPISSLLE